MKMRCDTVFYRIGQWIWIPFLLVGFWFAGYGYGGHFSPPECILQKISGFPCPGCGGTRAFYYLFSGEIVQSVRYHPAVLYGVLAYFHFMGLYFFRHHFPSKENAGAKEIPIPAYLYGAVIVIAVQWIIKILRILI
ncbi:MAG: DUF2752 domain-containing protein [Blautia sp.]|nr:DUF2752 domain-containing protein [Lachnoclostridium sp.]MCM1212742.1 DUF2752 domain-containing protein [Blautia sp.]